MVVEWKAGSQWKFKTEFKNIKMNQFSSLPHSAGLESIGIQQVTSQHNNNKKVLPNLNNSKSSQQLLSEIYRIIGSKSSQIPILKKKQSIDQTFEGAIWKCKCRKTKCLKLYCECFSLGEYCKSCNCIDCKNLVEYDDVRADAIDQALIRDPNAFDTKVRQRKGGCICKKTSCIKKYCECFSSGQQCSLQCKCINCENRLPKQESSLNDRQHENGNQDRIQQTVIKNSSNQQNDYLSG